MLFRSYGTGIGVGDIFAGKPMSREALMAERAAVLEQYGGVPRSNRRRKHHRNGRRTRGAQWGTAGEDSLVGLALAPSGSMYAVGYTTGALAGPNAGDGDGLIVRIAF